MPQHAGQQVNIQIAVNRFRKLGIPTIPIQYHKTLFHGDYHNSDGHDAEKVGNPSGTDNFKPHKEYL